MQTSAAKMAFIGQLVRRDFTSEGMGPTHPRQPLRTGGCAPRGGVTLLGHFHLTFTPNFTNSISVLIMQLLNV